MDNYKGELEDILGASSSPMQDDGNTKGEASVRNWHFQPVPDGIYENPNLDDFGDPFSYIKDPLMDGLDVPKSSILDNSTDFMKASVIFSPKARPSNLFSRIRQISPNYKEPIVGEMIIKASPNHLISSSNSSKTSLVGNSLGLQISSPGNTGIKRRKSQAKKVVCIPATTPVNNRPAGGEVVPSDLWAWRKYGQKPIKGSPYPRGYYRCSSSKGCSARKQVERSRNEPNMLIITYNSDHNHPWPTQRNALAGSTRSHLSKGSTQAQNEPEKILTNIKEEAKTVKNNFPNIGPSVKEENEYLENDCKSMDLNNDSAFYRPHLPPDMMNDGHTEDFFAELGEIGDDDDPLKMFFSITPGFPSDHEERESNEVLDEFPSFFEWIGISNTDNNNTSFEDTKRSL